MFVLKTQFIADTGDYLPELRLTSIPNTTQQLLELVTYLSSQTMILVLIQ